MTATARGASIGRSDAAVACRRRRSAEATPSADGRQRQLDFHRAGRRSGPDFKPRVAEDLAHRRVVGERRRVEPLEAVGRRAGGQPLEEQRADPFALKAVVHGECDFGGGVRQPDVRRDGDDADLARRRAAGDERERAPVIRRFGEPIDDRLGRLARRRRTGFAATRARDRGRSGATRPGPAARRSGRSRSSRHEARGARRPDRRSQAAAPESRALLRLSRPRRARRARRIRARDA